MISGSIISFWIVTIFVLASAAISALSSNIVKAAFSLFFTLFGIAGYYVLLGSGFLAITQVIIYVGGILVLLIFGILLTDRPQILPDPKTRSIPFLAIIIAALLPLFLATVIPFVSWSHLVNSPDLGDTLPSLGNMLLGRYAFTLLASGVTILICLIGAAYLVRRAE